jgi:hypothetical protein
MLKKDVSKVASKQYFYARSKTTGEVESLCFQESYGPIGKMDKKVLTVQEVKDCLDHWNEKSINYEYYLGKP